MGLAFDLNMIYLLTMKSMTLTFSQTKKEFSKVVDDVDRGKEVLFRRRDRLYTIQEIPPPQPIPLRPNGYFEHCRTAAEIGTLNRLAAKSKRKAYL